MKLTVRDAAQISKRIRRKAFIAGSNRALFPPTRSTTNIVSIGPSFWNGRLLRKINVSPEIFAEPEGGDAPSPNLSEALAAGGIHYRLGGSDKASVLQAVVDVMKLPEEVDRKFLYQVLLAREALGSTGIGDGIAIPHVRNPIVLHVLRPMVTLCFLEHPVEFGRWTAKPSRPSSPSSARPSERICISCHVSVSLSRCGF